MLFCMDKLETRVKMLYYIGTIIGVVRMSILDVKNLTHTFGDKKLFHDTGMSLFQGDKMGLTGLNGAGKTTFIQMLIGDLIPDKGSIRWNPKCKVSYLDQQVGVKEKKSVYEFLEGAFSDLIETERRLQDVNIKIAQTTDDNELYKLYMRAGAMQEELESRNFYGIKSQIDKISHGLSIHAFGMDTPLSNLSGGQRIRVLLAKMLLENPDVLILDEPTNFLDKENIDWLIKYLNGFKGAFILVSHDFDFLNKVVNCICDIEFGKMTRFNGDYKSFVSQKEGKHQEYIKQYNAQQKEVAALEEYINKNIVNILIRILFEHPLPLWQKVAARSWKRWNCWKSQMKFRRQPFSFPMRRRLEKRFCG